MKITFDKILIHRFKSFDDAEIDLSRGGFTLVSGINSNPVDNALSNGAGKSSWGDAIMWALTGETTQGISKNLANMKFNDGMYVRLFFSIGNDKFEILRSKDSKEYGTNLNIIINGQNKSGKGIRDSEKLLSQYLPDLNASLIGSCIILGQGLPQCFTNNTPSGRKEVLEKLSKSDFMIDDIKVRISKRKAELDGEIRKREDELIRLTSSLQTAQISFDNATNQLNTLDNLGVIDESILSIKTQISTQETVLNNTENQYQEAFDSYSKTSSKITEKNMELNLRVKDLQMKEMQEKSSLSELKSALQLQESNYRSEINRILSIRDVCPTCGQRIPNVIKPDTSELEGKVEAVSTQLRDITEKLNSITTKYSNEKKAVDQSHQIEVYDLKKLQSEQFQVVQNLNNSKSSLNTELRTLQSKLQNLTLERNTYQMKIDNCKKVIEEFEVIKKDIDEKVLYNTSEKERLTSHRDVISKISTLTTRDFRGFLLKNVIDFIDKKAKEYSKDIFDTDRIAFELNGNNIDVSYDGKPVENLSGGERQKVNLIIQFAIRDMMCQFMNFSSSIIILDEVFDNLDSQGVSKILNMITRRLTDIEDIFIISHHSSELDIPYDNELIIEKGVDGISRVK